MLRGCLFGQHDSHYSRRTLAILCYSPLYEYTYGHGTLLRFHGFGVVSCHLAFKHWHVKVSKGSTQQLQAC